MRKSLAPQTIRPTLWCFAGLVMGGLLVAGVSTLRQQQLNVENKQLRADLEARDKQRADALQRVEELNGQIGLLREQVKQARGVKPERLPAPATGRVKKPSTAGVAVTSEAYRTDPGAKRLTLGDVPAQVQAALMRKAGALDVSELEIVSEDGQVVYQVRGVTSDGRQVGLRISPDGAVVSGKSEVAVEGLPNRVREAVAQTWGEVQVEKAREILQKDQAIYDLVGRTSDGRKFNLSLGAEGTLISAETEVSPDNLPQPVQNALAGRLGAEANPVVRQVYADERLTYDVVTKTEAAKTRFVVGQDGTLLSSESWFRPPKPSK